MQSRSDRLGDAARRSGLIPSDWNVAWLSVKPDATGSTHNVQFDRRRVSPSPGHRARRRLNRPPGKWPVVSRTRARRRVRDAQRHPPLRAGSPHHREFCAIAAGVTFVMNGANHRMNGVSTYPFPIMGGAWSEHVDLIHDLPSRGETVVGNDVWIGADATIMPGVPSAMERSSPLVLWSPRRFPTMR